VSGEGTRLVCTNSRDPSENSDLLSCGGGFLQTFREQIRGFHDFCLSKLSKHIILLGLFDTEDGGDMFLRNVG
jgi:hypothetical protein